MRNAELLFHAENTEDAEGMTNVERSEESSKDERVMMTIRSASIQHIIIN